MYEYYLLFVDCFSICIFVLLLSHSLLRVLLKSVMSKSVVCASYARMILEVPCNDVHSSQRSISQQSGIVPQRNKATNYSATATEKICIIY